MGPLMSDLVDFPIQVLFSDLVLNIAARRCCKYGIDFHTLSGIVATDWLRELCKSGNNTNIPQNSAEHATHFSIFHSDSALYIVEDAANYGNLPLLRFMYLNQLFKMQKEHLSTLSVWKYAQL